MGAGAGALAVDEQTGVLFVGDYYADAVRLIDTAAGAVRRTVDLGGRPLAIVVDARLHRAWIATAGPRSRLFMLDSRTGAVRRTLQLGQSVTAMLCASGTGHLVL